MMTSSPRETVRSRAVDAHLTAAALPRQGVGLQLRAVELLDDQHLLVLLESDSLHQVGVERDQPM